MRGYHDSPLSAFLHKQEVSFPIYFRIHVNAVQSHEHVGDTSVLNHETNVYCREWKSGTWTSFDMFVIYLYTEFHILLLNVISYSLYEGYLSTYIFNIRCHRIQVVQILVVIDIRTKTGFPYVLTRDKSCGIRYSKFKTHWPIPT